MSNTILVIEDDATVRANIVDLLEAEGFDALAAADGEKGIELAVKHLPDLIVCDVGMPGIDGFEVYEILSSRDSTAVIPFIFLSARAERKDVRRGMTLGADDYLTKPFTRAELLETIATRLRRRKPPPDDAPPSSPSAGLGELVVHDPAMAEVLAQLDRIAPSPISVLVLGETGVGKELIAEELHRRSGRRGPFVPINCAALTESLLESELFGHEKGAFTGALQAKQGLFEAAHGGTLFLDEVGELPASTQAKLLRVLEERKVLRVGGRTARAVDVRFVSATNRDVEAAAERGDYRADLFFRLNGISIQVPPLRERSADIAPMARRFAAVHCASMGREPVPELSAEALAVLERYDWPGNIRELRNVIDRAVLLCKRDRITPEDVPDKLREPQRASPVPDDADATAPDSDPRARLMREIEQLERDKVAAALAQCGGNQTKAAALLGISRRTLVTRLSEYGLPRPRKKRD